MKPNTSATPNPTIDIIFPKQSNTIFIWTSPTRHTTFFFYFSLGRSRATPLKRSCASTPLQVLRLARIRINLSLAMQNNATKYIKNNNRSLADKRYERPQAVP